MSESSTLTSSITQRVQDYLNQQAHGQLYNSVIGEVEKPLLKLALAQCAGNQIKAAAMLGLNRNTLRKKIRLHGIQPRNKMKGDVRG